MGIIASAIAKPRKINLCDYGINLWSLLQHGDGEWAAQKMNVCMDMPGLGKECIVINDDGVNPIVTLHNPVIAYTQDGAFAQISFSFCGCTSTTTAVSSNIMITPFVFNNGESEIQGLNVFWTTKMMSLPEDTVDI